MGRIEGVLLKHAQHHSKRDSPWDLLCDTGSSNPVLLDSLEGWGGVEAGGRFTYIHLCPIRLDVWQKPTHHYKVIILQLKINYFFLKGGRKISTNGKKKTDLPRNLLPILFSQRKQEVS